MQSESTPKSEIPESILTLCENMISILDAPEKSKEYRDKIKLLLNYLLESPANVYCEDCGLIFFEGLVDTVLNEKRFVDWKMLSFRHCWDTRHKVKVALPMFVAFKAQLIKSPMFFTLIKNLLPIFKFDDFGNVCYYLEVEDLRERLEMRGSKQAFNSSDVNWDRGSRCVCSFCGKNYYDPKKACLCHSDTKPWLPMGEVESIRVKPL